jgi:hypothetical protein
MGVHNLIIYGTFPTLIEAFLSSEPPCFYRIDKADNNFIISLLVLQGLGTGLMEKLIIRFSICSGTPFRDDRVLRQTPVKNGAETVYENG